VDVVTCTAGGAVVDRQTLHPVLRQLRPRPLPRVVEAHAERDGTRVSLTWRTDRPARLVLFSATAGPSAFAAPVPGRGRTRFHATLDNVASTATHVELVTISNEGGRARRLRVAIRD
jgi:hypothetical protein